MRTSVTVTALTVLCVVLAVAMMSESVEAKGQDYYTLLGVKRGATPAQIKRSYRKMASKMHPDLHPGDKKAEEVWMEITRAYEVLSDARQREIYDQHGEEGVNQSGHQQQQQGATINFGGPGGFTINFGGPNDGEDKYEVPKGPDLVMDLPVSLRDLYLGRELEIVRASNDKEEGRGTRKCNCRQQMVTRQQGYFIQQVMETKCDECPSVDFVPSVRTLEVEIEKGARDGHEISFSEASDPVLDGTTGNLVLRLRTMPHARFRRVGDDLHVDEHISLLQSLVGFDYTIKHLDNHEVRLARTEPTKPGFEMIVPSEGMPRTEDPYYFGDLHVHFTIDYPETLTEEQREGVQKLFSS